MVRWRWEREGVKDGCYNLLLAAAACPWPDRSAIGYLKWGHLRSWPRFCGTGFNSRGVWEQPCHMHLLIPCHFQGQGRVFSHNVGTFTQYDFNCCCICWFIFLYKQDHWYIYTWSLFPFERGNRSWKRHLHMKYIHKTHSDSVLPGSIL